MIEGLHLKICRTTPIYPADKSGAAIKERRIVARNRAAVDSACNSFQT